MNTLDQWETEAKKDGEQNGKIGLAAISEVRLLALIDSMRKKDEAFRNIQNMINDQALDEGLWFCTSNVTEAYLQQELRKLHSISEINIKEAVALTEELK